MALRARLAPPPPAPEGEWRYHKAQVGSIAASVLCSGDRRMEAESYLSSGYGIRTSIESKPSGWKRLSDLARSWQPNRLKGIQVSPKFGTPFLAATQVFDVRPIPRKWLALDKTSDAKNRFVSQGAIVVTCSGSVGRPTLCYKAHEDTLISHDLLRVKALDPEHNGWIYAYLMAWQTRAMTRSAHYGHIIKHLETSHLDSLPVPIICDMAAGDFSIRVAAILDLRNEGHRLTLEAEERFERCVGSVSIENWGEGGFSAKASRSLMSGRRRMEATIHNPGVAAIKKHLAKAGLGFTTIADAGYTVWLPSRFRRIPADAGVPFMDSADLTEVNPDITKTIADGDFGDPSRGRVESGWILMARSGQAYGIIGSTVLAEQDLENRVISDHVMRIKPGPAVAIDPGYLLIALSHPQFGRPLLKSIAYGSSIPEIDVSDVQAFEVVRLPANQERHIADLARRAAKARSEADMMERSVAEDASVLIDEFITGRMP